MIPHSYDLENLAKARQAVWEKLIHDEALLRDSTEEKRKGTPGMNSNIYRRVVGFFQHFTAKKKGCDPFLS